MAEGRLSGRHALVTGGGSGIGAAIARRFAAEGARLTLVGRRREPIRDLAGELEGIAVSADVTDPSAVERAFAEARAGNGPLSILVANAGAGSSAPFEKLSLEDWRAAMAVNCEAVFHCCRAALPDLRAGADGRIVAIASTAGLKGYAYAAHYVAAKHGAVGLMRALAIELAETGITANALCPGFTDTGMAAAAITNIADKTGRGEEEARAALAEFNPQRRLIDPREVAEAALWLCLPESRSVTGQAIAVAGGEVMCG
ncbi:MAG: SDR family NAD(P)-dependent oxidoreductase [Sphingomonadaceae bacterium]